MRKRSRQSGRSGADSVAFSAVFYQGYDEGTTTPGSQELASPETSNKFPNKKYTRNDNMIQLSRNYSLPEREDQIIRIKVIAVGSAGSNALDRVVLDGMDKSDLIAANTDVQSLASSVAAVKVQLGRSLTRGLGTGGVPELGFDAAQESA